MFLYINKALGRLGKEQKEKPIIITTWAVAEMFGTKRGGRKEVANQSNQKWCQR